MCKIIAKQFCNKCGKGIFAKVIRIVEKGKIPVWNNITKNWDNVKYYHPNCVSNINNEVKKNG